MAEAVCVVCVPAHLVPPGSSQDRQLHHLHALLSQGQSFHRPKKKILASMHAGSLQSCPTLSDPVDCGLPGFSVRGILQARILERIGRFWLPYPFRALYFLLPQPLTPLSTWCCQNPCDPSSCTTSTSSPHWGRPKSSRAASGTNPSGQSTSDVEIKPQLKPRGSVAKEEDPKPSHQLYKLQIKSI